MSVAELVRTQLREGFPITEMGDSVAVSTPVLYPSNSNVTVHISGGAAHCVVSDGGGATRHALSHGATIPDASAWLRGLLKNSQMRASAGMIVSPQIEFRELPWAIALVARASAEAVVNAIENHMKRLVRDLSGETYDVLAKAFGPSNVAHEVAFAGASNRRYHFDYGVAIGRKSQLLLDVVSPNANSVNAKAIAHIDVSHLTKNAPKRAIVYDPDQDWDAADINLLNEAGLLLPIAALAREIPTYARMH
ncbi:MAG: hypothetical protein U1F24_09595 [Alphaproteobacteria bacterium]